ncbi:MAG TPA: AMP-binding protein [Solirubrobacterales bacterium]|nr:AMP-binding protein [Solirubrobacterales bacterium]
MNFVEDVMERAPASTLGIVAIDAAGNRREWHYGELIARSAGLSGAMAARDVERGDAVMTLVGSRIEWVLAMLACFRMGAVALPCNPQLRRKDLEIRVQAAEPKLCIGEEDLLGELPDGVPSMTMAEIADALDEDLPQETPAETVELDAEDPAVIIFTSGTTGQPKGVVYPQRYLTGQRLQAEHWVGARGGELAWCTAAPGWSKSTRNVFIAPWLRGAAALLHDARFDPGERLGIIEREGVNVLCQAPTEYRILAKRTELRPIGSLRRMVSAGEPLNPEVIRAFREAMGIGIGDGYGQTETGPVTGMRPEEDDPARDGSMGRPLPGIEVRIADGELQVRPETVPTFFSHYLGEEPFEGEWWATGDHVHRDDDGYLWFEGRDDDIIITAGYRVGPFEVESALVSHPAVAEAAAVPAPDEERGSVVRAIVVLADADPSDELAAELQDHVKRVTAPYKYPRIVEFTDELPKTSSGKIRRAELRR